MGIVSGARIAISGICVHWRKRSAKGIGSAGHLIHRGAVPLPLKGKDNARGSVGLTANVGRLGLSQTSSTAAAVPLPLQGEGLSAREIVAGLSKSSPLCYLVSGLWSLVKSGAFY